MHYRAYVIKGVKVAPSPAWLQQLLKSIGARPINNIVDITNYILFSLGQPLHAFDLKNIEGAQLQVRRATSGEKLKTLDEKDRVLDPSMLVIADAKKPLVIAGIMGGVSSGVRADTTDIVLEAAHFHPTVVRRTSRKLALSSDSSARYQRGIDPLALQPAAERAVALILELAGGTLEGAPLVSGSAPQPQRVFELSREYIAEQLGWTVDCEIIERALTGFGFQLEPTGQTSWRVAVPSYRLDIERPVDFVEEVLRYIGVDKIPVSTPVIHATQAQSDRIYTASRQLSDRLVALGYHECMHYTLRTKAEVEALVGATAAKLHALENPLSADMSHLRSSLVPGLVQALELNRSRGNDSAIKLFEVGHTFAVVEGKLTELLSIAFVQKLSPLPERWQVAAPADFFSARALLESLATAAGVALPVGEWAASGSAALWQPYHSASLGCLQHQGVQLSAGLASLQLLKANGFSGQVLAGELTLALNLLEDQLPTIARYTPFSQFPPTRRDIALIVPTATPAGTVLQAVHKAASGAIAGRFQLEEVALFDRYRGAGIPEGTQSLAFALTLRSLEGTLTDEQVNSVLATVIAGLQAQGYALRG